MPEDVATEAPQEQVPQEPVQEQVQDVEQVPETPEPVEAPEPVVQETTAPEPEVEEVEDYDYTAPQVPQYQQPPVDINQLPMDAEGNIDPNAFAQAIYMQAQQAAVAQARQEVAEQLKEQKLWEQAEKAHPELREDRAMREMVKNARLGQMAASLGQKNPTPKQIADQLFSRVNSAKQQGVTQAQENVRIQESATLETASNVAKTDGVESIRSAMQSGDPKVREDANRAYLRHLIDSGDIAIGG